MRRQSYILGAVVLACAAAGFACSLNPQPFPPATFGGSPDAGVTDDAASPFLDGSAADAGGGTETGPPPADAGADGADAGSDAAPDGGDAGDAGDADVPSDAALAEGG